MTCPFRPPSRPRTIQFGTVYRPAASRTRVQTEGARDFRANLAAQYEHTHLSGLAAALRPRDFSVQLGLHVTALRQCRAALARVAEEDTEL